MKLSIIIPVYNAERFLVDCLRSITAEQGSEIEIILLDDGSQDSSHTLMQRYAGRNIRVFRHENHGVSYTRNRGIREAEGEYIMFVDADDMLCPGWSAAVLRGCESGRDVIYFGNCFSGNADSVRKIDIVRNIFGISHPMALGCMSSPWSKLYKREFILREGIAFNSGLINGEDGLFNLEAVLKAGSFACIGESFYRYRVYTGSSSRRYSERFFDANILYFSIAEKLLRAGNVESGEIARCMAYSVAYSVYLYLVLVSALDDNTLKNRALRQLFEPRMADYIARYPDCTDCAGTVQVVYRLVSRRRVSAALCVVGLRNYLLSRKKREIKWETV